MISRLRALTVWLGVPVTVFVAGIAVAADTATVVPDPCAPTSVDINGWRQLSTVPGRFTVLLPASAREPRLPCVDSSCGRVELGNWQLEYDRGVLAGPGNRARVPEAARDVRRCTMRLADRHASLVCFKTASSERSHDATKVGCEVALVVREQEGLYIWMSSESVQAASEFLAAVPTLQVQ